ncbi:hypothetical protein HELRODRAFT_180472 [Helobdella robusta]|uniref:Uncharacterized protein n=1 Tax=Helobdella robusta TaxID=6412 RepID=T1FFZ0_HELRO|nr:hypothetical protein HELRODRAFT_180472 [Helobdella robusta]ESN93822.1 hypothetical protein HELRODRAFT_180472 [Helobdella robusta]
MASTRAVQINELLFYLFNNLSSLENVSFINSVKQFYNLDEFNTGKKVLLNDLENSKTDNSCFKLTQRANNKYDKLLDIIDIVKFCTDKKVDLPTYVAADFSKIPEPRLEHFLNLFELKFKSLKTNLNKRITEIAQIANNLKLNNSTVHSQHVVPITLNARDIKNNTSNLWSDKVMQEKLIDTDEVIQKNLIDLKFSNFQILKSQIQNLKFSNSNSNSNLVLKKLYQWMLTMPGQPSNNEPAMKRSSIKTFDAGNNCPLKSSKTIEKRATYYLGNVESCKKEVIENLLKSNNILFIHCFPVFRKRKTDDATEFDKNTQQQSTAF